MHEMAIDIDQAGAIWTAFDDMRVPNLFIERARLDHNDFPLDPDRTGEKGKSGQISAFRGWPRRGGKVRRSGGAMVLHDAPGRSEEHTSELQSLMRISYAVFCLKKKTQTQPPPQPLTYQPTPHSLHHPITPPYQQQP